MKRSKLIAAAAAIITATALTACGSSGSTSSSSSAGAAGSDSKEITWWATNQAASLDEDAAILNPELAKFKAASGVNVTVEVVPWKDLYSRITSAVTSGKGPDVVSIGNTWSSSLQSTGAFTEFDEAAITDLGGESQFVKSLIRHHRRRRPTADLDSAARPGLRPVLQQGDVPRGAVCNHRRHGLN